MPEGDTVWRHARALDAALTGRVVTRSDFRTPTLATASLRNARVAGVESRGKHLLMRFDVPERGAWTLRSHLRMDGTWRIFGPGERWRGRPAHTIRVVIEVPDAVAVGFHLHDLALVPAAAEGTLVGHLGPDLLGPGWDPDEAVRRLTADPDREIAAALLDQRNLAGIGNLYKCELLFLRGVSPWTPVGRAGDLAAMVDLAHRLLAANVGSWDQVTTGNTRRGQRTYVFERTGQPCRRCGTLVRQARQAPRDLQDRVTYWCPTCQPGPSPRSAHGGSPDDDGRLGRH